MSKASTWGLVASVAFVIAAPSAMAQPGGPGGPPGGPGGFGRGPMMGPPGGGLLALATNAEVQKELGLDDEQAGYVELLEEDVRDENREFFESLRDVSREERFTKIREFQEKHMPEVDSQLKEIIGDEKLARLKQIRLQAGGVMMILAPDVSKEVGLTDDQQSQIREVLRESFGQFGRGGRRGGPGGPPGGEAEGSEDSRREQRQTMRKQLEEKIEGVLTDRQKERWQKMLGEPANIDFDKLRRPPEDGRGRGRDNGGPRRRRGPDGQGQGNEPGETT